MTTPADELHAAATKLRALATAASTDTDGTPTTHWNTELRTDDRTVLLYGDYLTRDDGRRIPWPPLVRGGSFPPAFVHAHPARRLRRRHGTHRRPRPRRLAGDRGRNLGRRRDPQPVQRTNPHPHAALAVARAINSGGKPQ